jgi:hypothetical protein
MTDMGRTYIVLGQPTSIERFDATLGIYPCQVWYYYGDKAKGLPTYFGLLFFQRGGGGEYKLYNPVADGPASLLIDTRKIDTSDYQKLYQKIKELAPTLAGPAISIIPDEHPYYYAPSPRNAILIAQIFDSPKKDVSAAYATHFLSYKGVVSTEYLTNYVECGASLALLDDPLLGLEFLHFSISPKKISADYYEPRDQYYSNFKLSVSLRRGEKVVFQYSRDYPFYFPPDKLENIQGNGVSILDVFPVAEGTYGLTILLQNAVGKEFSVFEKEVTVPAEGGAVRMTEPVLGYGLQGAPAAGAAPFKVLGTQLLTDPKNTLGASDVVAYGFDIVNVSQDLWSAGAVEVSVEGSAAKDKPAKAFALRLADRPYGRTVNILGSFPARDLPPDYYEMKFSLKDGRGNVLGTVLSPFVVSPAEAVPHPVTLVRTLPAASNFLYYYELAGQYDGVGDIPRAEALYRRAREMKPDYAEGLVNFAEFMLRAKKYDDCLALVEPLKDDPKFRFDHFLIKGRAQSEKGEFGPAIASLLEGNKIYNSDTRLLNALGFCYYKTGKKKEALEVLAASLRLNTEQPEVRDLLGRVERDLKLP